MLNLRSQVFRVQLAKQAIPKVLVSILLARSCDCFTLTPASNLLQACDHFRNPSNSKSQACDVGFASQNGSATCTQCASGKFATTEASNYSYGVVTEATVCQPCQPGSHIEYRGSIFCTTCESGTYSTGGNSSCARYKHRCVASHHFAPT